jgi:peptidoglycan/LPS O-acetylase OafA/YrhL
MARGGKTGALFDPARFLDDLKQPGLVSAIDLARWLAASIVAIGHARFALLKGYGFLDAADRPLWVQGWYFVTGYFVEAVLVFFVLSGFLVGGMGLARMQQRSFGAAGYAVDRFSRLYTAFLPALVLTAVLTAIGIHWFGATGLFDGTNPTFAEKGNMMNFAANTSWQTFVGNMVMVQGFAVPEYGANPPLWTLSLEFWFYVVFGLAGAAAMRQGAARLCFAILAVTALVVLGPMFWVYLGMWLLGVVAAVVRPPRWPLRAPSLTVTALALLAGLLLLRRYADAALDPSDILRFGIQYGICAAMALLLLGLRSCPLKGPLPMAKFHKFMADFSYSLYLIHFPVLMLAAAVLGTLTGNPGYRTGFAPTEPLALASYAGSLAIAYGFAWIFAAATERQTGRVRRWVKARINTKLR